MRHKQEVGDNMEFTLNDFCLTFVLAVAILAVYKWIRSGKDV